MCGTSRCLNSWNQGIGFSLPGKSSVSPRVLVLNHNYEPLNVCPVRRAFCLVGDGKAEIVEPGIVVLRSATRDFICPSVIRLMYLVKRVHPVAKLTRREVFLRDNYTCQYCGKQTKDLTLDHVVPRHRGGPHRWENLVSACKPCNHRKGGRNPEEARMELISAPHQPRVSRYYWVHQHLHGTYDPAWVKFIPDAHRLSG
jgi:5-methylcytosine-specific restriction endonuclease McrA